MKAPAVTTIDFETKKIQGRPVYPPVPVGFSIKTPKMKKPIYHRWGHPTKNNCTLVQAKKILQTAWKDKTQKLFYNAKFDLDVANTHMGCRMLEWNEYHDAMFLVFLNDPHAKSLGLKPQAEKLLGMKPDERDEVTEWLKKNSGIKLQKGEKWGAYISEAPGDIVGKYADGDVIRTEAVFKLLYPKIVDDGMQHAYERELKLVPVFLDNEREGLLIDTKRLKKDIPMYHKAMKDVEKWLCKRLKAKDVNFDADIDVSNLLNDNGIVTDWTLTKTGKLSVSKKNLTKDKYKDEKVFLALGYRNRLKTCLSMFMEPWLIQASANNNRIHPNWNQVRQPKAGKEDNKGTRTGRPSCDNPNLLNLSKSFYDRGDAYEHPKFIKDLPELPLVRKYTLPDEGCIWIHRDYNQQELRILAHFEDGSILAAYQEDVDLDVHDFVQSEIKRIRGKLYDRVSVKTINFGKIYGQGLGALAEKMNTTVEEVKSIRDAQNKALPGLKVLEDAIKETSRAGDPIVTWGGRLYYVEPPQYVEKFKREMTFEYKLINYLVQGSAADITKEAIVRYHYTGAGYVKRVKRKGRFLVTVYDEINICVPKEHLKTENAILKECMESIELDVHMRSDCKIGKSWGDLTKYKETA